MKDAPSPRREEVALQTTSAGILLPVKAQPGSRRTGIVGIHAGALKVAVTAAPEKGKANVAVMETLIAALQIKPSEITLHSGATASQKKFLITGLSEDELRNRLAELTTG